MKVSARLKAIWPKAWLDRAVLFCWILALVAVLVRVWIQPGRHTVFGVYREAGMRWLEGSELYVRVGKFLYSPLAAALFAPFAIIPERLAGFIWHLLCGVTFYVVVRAAARVTFVGAHATRNANWFLLALLPLVLGNINNGQTGLLVITLLIAGVLSVARGHWHLAAVCIAMASFLKIYPLALGLLLILFYPRELSWRLALWLVGLFLLSLLLQRPAYVVSQYQEWFASLGADQRRFTGPYGLWRDAWFLLRLAGVPITLSMYAALQIAGGFSVAAFCLWGRYRNWNQRRCLTAAFCLGTGWMILFGPSTESATYAILAPAVVYGAIAVTVSTASAWLRAGMWAAYGFLVLGTSTNSWLNTTGLTACARALQPLGTLIFVITASAWLSKDSLWEKTDSAGVTTAAAG